MQFYEECPDCFRTRPWTPLECHECHGLGSLAYPRPRTLDYVDERCRSCHGSMTEPVCGCSTVKARPEMYA